MIARPDPIFLQPKNLVDGIPSFLKDTGITIRTIDGTVHGEMFPLQIHHARAQFRLHQGHRLRRRGGKCSEVCSR
jgi:hypothetical protein